MISLSPYSRLAIASFLIAWFHAALPLHAQAQSATGEAAFSVETAGEPLSLRVNTLTDDAVVRADLHALAEGMGAGVALSSTRVQVDLGGDSAWSYINDTRVTSSRTNFDLARPIIQRDGRSWIAVSDVAGYFNRGFGVTVRMAQAAAAAPPEEDDAPLDPLLNAEPLLLDVDPIVEPDDSPTTPDQPAPDPLQNLSNDAIQGLRTARGPERIVIDPGHGGEDTGVIGPSGVMEKDVTLAVAQALQTQLSGRIGREVVLTRGDDRPLDMAQRAALVESPQSTLFISIHCGGAFAPGATGAQLFYLPDVIDDATRQLTAVERQPAIAQRTANATTSRRLAERVGRSLSERANMPLRGVRGVTSRVLLAANSPGIVVELGFLTTSSEEERLGSPAYQQVLAEALAEGILAFYGLETPGAAR